LTLAAGDRYVEAMEPSASELACRIARRELSAVEALAAQLAIIERRNPSLIAVVSMDVEGARRDAEAADAELARGVSRGPLHGVPITLKDSIDVAGLRTTIGSPIFDRVADQDATVAARLRAAGAIIFGHSNVTPFLAGFQSDNSIFGSTSNPWNLERTAGGSSGGAAAAVATGMTAFEVGSDLAGSIRLPAHFCGVYGLKTTEHRVPMTGFFRLPPGTPPPLRIITCLGPMARELDDLELVLSLISGPDGIEVDVPPVPLIAEPPVRLDGLRLAFATSMPGTTVGRVMKEQVTRVATQAAQAGARVEERLPDCDWEGGGALFGKLLRTLTSVPITESLAWYLAALHERDQYMNACDALFRDVDALLLPAAMMTAFPHCEPGAPLEVDGENEPYFDLTGVLAMANLGGLPALVAPAAADFEGLPIGVQIVGPRWSETRLLRICRTLESAGILPGFRPPPGT
jgi:amidase